ncbi:MAG: RcpC/CpaB family pilus assembly protein [Actinomycetota bacterium]
MVQQGARRSWTGRISQGHVVMVAAGLLGAVLTLGSLRAADDRRAVLAAAADIPAGTVIEDGTLRVTRIDASNEVMGSLYAPDELDMLQGSVTTAALRAGSLVARDLVRPGSPGAVPRAMSFPLSPARAVGGALEAGDRVDVLAVSRDGDRAGYVMTAIEVLGVDGDDAGPLGAPDELTITLAVELNAAVTLAAALDTGTVTLVRATGASIAVDPPLFAGVAAGPDTNG